MEDRLSKLIRLFGAILITFIGVLVVLALFLLLMRFLFGILDGMSWFVYGYMILIIMIPPVLFISVYALLLRHSSKHPSRIVKWISRVPYILALIAWVILMVIDLRNFFINGKQSIEHYYGFEPLILFFNILLILIIGIVQALAMPPEEDWLHKRKRKELLEN